MVPEPDPIWLLLLGALPFAWKILRSRQALDCLRARSIRLRRIRSTICPCRTRSCRQTYPSPRRERAHASQEKLRRVASSEFGSCRKVGRQWLKGAAALFLVAFLIVLQQVGAFDQAFYRAKKFVREITGRPSAGPTFADNHVFTDVPDIARRDSGAPVVWWQLPGCPPVRSRAKRASLRQCHPI